MIHDIKNKEFSIMVNLGRTNLNISNRYNYLGWCVPFNYAVKRRVKKRYLSKNKCKDPGGENKHTHTHKKSTANIWWSQGNGEKKHKMRLEK